MAQMPNFWVVVVKSVDGARIELSKEERNQVLWTGISGQRPPITNPMGELFVNPGVRIVLLAETLDPHTAAKTTDVLDFVAATTRGATQVLYAGQAEYEELKRNYDRNTSPERK